MPEIPVEILDRIISFIENPKDMVSPNLASKLFAAIVRAHIEYRVIRCTLCTTDLWDLLSRNAALAQNVRSLDILRQQQYLNNVNLPPIVPKQFVEHAYDKENRKFYGALPIADFPRLREAERSLIRAIKNMCNLKSFTWNRCAPVLDSILDEEEEEDIWTALRTSCPNLEHLSVMDASELDYVRPVHHSALWTLGQDLKSFRYHTYAYRHLDRRVPMEELTSLLRRCPNLENLSLGFTLYSREDSEDGEDISSADLSGLMSDIHWPNLRTLKTASVHISSTTARRFFKSHPTITKLHIMENTEQARFIKDETFNADVYPIPDPSLTLLPATLPNLTDVSVPKYIFRAIQVAQGPSSGLQTGFRKEYGSCHWIAPPGTTALAREA